MRPRADARGLIRASIRDSSNASFAITTAGRRAYRVRIEEPEPGCVLVERDTASSLATTFTVTPEGEGRRVRIETTWQGAGGLGGLMERLFAPRVLRNLYADELARLDAYAREQTPA